MPRIPQLASATSADSNDELPFEDVSASTTKKITKADYLKDTATYMTAGSVTTAKLDDGAVTGTKLGIGSAAIAGDNALTANQTTTSTTPQNVNAGNAGAWPSVTTTGGSLMVLLTLPIHTSGQTFTMGVTVNGTNYPLSAGNNQSSLPIIGMRMITGLPAGTYVLQPTFNAQSGSVTATITAFRTMSLAAWEV